MKVRAQLYKVGLCKSRSLPCKVICVGNLSFGGTGKTPMVLWLANQLRAQDKEVGILSRGYKAGPSGNDEAAIISEFLPGVPHIEKPNRVKGGEELIARFGVDAIVLDDGFQHLRLQRDLNLLLIDATDPFGGGYCLPAGRLRESISAIRRADLVLLTRADLVSEEEKKKIWATVHRYLPQAPQVEVAFVPSGLLQTETGQVVAADFFREHQVVLLSAIGNPKGFRMTVEKLGMRVGRNFRFRDHHRYLGSEIRQVFAQAAERAVLTTRKDWVKIRELKMPFHPWVLEIEPKFLCGEEHLLHKIEALWPT